MTNSYDQEIYNFFTEPDNYRASKNIVANISEVENEVKKDFWKQIENNVVEYVQVYDWKVDNKFPGWFGIHKEHSPHIGISFDNLAGRPDFGIFGSKDIYERNDFNNKIKEVKSKYNMKGYSDAWPCYRFIGHDFNQQNTIENILPGNRSAMVEEMTTTIKLFFNDCREIIEEIEYISKEQ
jgi:hypothetical protein